MPRRESQNAQTSKNPWWVPTIIGLVLLVVPGGAFVAPVFFIVSIIMKARKPKSPETPHSLLPLINITP
jgi:flagellar basal body-associated protein FliL